MKPWEIYSWQAPDMEEAHPAVVVSGVDRVANKPVINLLICQSQRANRPAGPHEILLDSADGLDWETLCRCDLIQVARKSEVSHRRGIVCPERRRAIAAKVVQCLAFGSL